MHSSSSDIKVGGNRYRRGDSEDIIGIGRGPYGGRTAVTRRKPEPATEASKYKPTERELSAVRKFSEKRAVELATRIKFSNENGRQRIAVDHQNVAVGYALLAEALGTANIDFIDGIIDQLAQAGSRGTIDPKEINFMLGVIKGIKPNDQIEVMLAAQMAAVHITAMKFAQHFPRIESIPQQDAAERAFNKLMRTFTMQMDALKRYRTGGEQKVTVQHVSVGEGGQAIVGNVTQATPSAAPPKTEVKPKALTVSQQPAMPIIDRPARAPVAVRRKQKNEG
jgi:hypothetical protein